MRHTASIPAKAREYFSDHPIIAATWKSGAGWRGYPIRKRVSINALRVLRREGVQMVALRGTSRHDLALLGLSREATADFGIRELLT